MPAKKQVGVAPVYGMEHEKQVRLLSDALLREYMHRRGFHETLKVFDAENPRDAETISSRALMSDLMALQQDDQQRLKSEGIETIMEMLCNLRVERRQLVESLKARASTPIPEIPLAQPEEEVHETRSSEKKPKKKATKKNQKIEPISTSRPDIIRLEKEMTLDDLLEGGSEPPPKATHSLPNRLTLSPLVAPPPSVPSVQADAPPPRVSAPSDDDTTLEKVGKCYDEMIESGKPCPPEMLRDACALLCGSSGTPLDSYLQQGISFEDNIGFRLIQWKKGLSAAIAPIQAFIIAFYFERLVLESREHQCNSCIRALTHILNTAQPDSSKIILVDGLFYRRLPKRDFQKRCENFTYWTSFASKRDVEERLNALVDEHWSIRKGSGLWCFLLSLVLSRGVPKVKQDGCALPLVQANAPNFGLLNLVLCGAAIAASTPEEYIGVQMQCGLLNGNDPGEGAASPVTTGEPSAPSGSCFNPVYPSWVIAHNTHFTNLFMKKDLRKVFQEKQGLGGTATVELLFWDALTEDDVITAEVQVTREAWGSRKRNVASFLTTAILSVPQWSSGVIDWGEGYPPQ